MVAGERVVPGAQLVPAYTQLVGRVEPKAADVRSILIMGIIKTIMMIILMMMMMMMIMITMVITTTVIQPTTNNNNDDGDDDDGDDCCDVKQE